jgi:hypothetical protein
VRLQPAGAKVASGSLVVKLTEPLGDGDKVVTCAAVTVAVQVPVTPIVLTLQPTVVVVESVTVIVAAPLLGALWVSPG